MSTAQKLYDLSVHSHQAWRDKRREKLLDRCKAAAKDGYFYVDLTIDELPTARELCEKDGYFVMSCKRKNRYLSWKYKELVKN